jgi:hypothetical protein
LKVRVLERRVVSGLVDAPGQGVVARADLLIGDDALPE